WDESDKFVKVYITLQGVQNANPSTIQHSFTNTGYDITVSNHGGKNYVMTMKGLRDEIVPESSQIKLLFGTVEISTYDSDSFGASGFHIL
ncbi:CS domain protein, partial [Ostertagia ostertagi]